MHSQAISTATEHAEADSTATEHVESAKESNPFRALAEDILSNHLTPQQVQNPEYKVRKGKALTTKQRSTVNAILRKNLGDARVARFIFNHGVPTLLDLPIEREAPNRALLQKMFEEL